MSRRVFGVCVICGTVNDRSRPLGVYLIGDDGTGIFYCHECARSSYSTILFMWINTGIWPSDIPLLGFLAPPSVP